MFGLDALADGAGTHELGDVALEGGPPHRAAGQRHSLVAPEVAAQRGGVELLEHYAAEVWAVLNAQAVAARRRAEKQAVAPHVGATCMGGRATDVRDREVVPRDEVDARLVVGQVALGAEPLQGRVVRAQLERLACP